MKKAFILLGAAVFLVAASQQGDLWNQARIEHCLKALDRQKAQGLITEMRYRQKRAMLEGRLKGTFRPTALATRESGEVNFIQNGGFEQINRNTARNRSRWLWWNGWSWGGDYENFWATGADAHSGKYAAGIRCTGKRGRIGIFTPKLPIPDGTTELVLTFWGKGKGDNQLFVNFESGATGRLRTKLPPKWTKFTVRGKPARGAKEFTVFIYSIGGGTIYLDDMKLVPVGAKLDE